VKPDKNISSPIYKQIEEWIRDNITSGKWPVHYKLKAEIDLAEELSVSRGTIRKSIQNLVKKGLLTQVHGKGTFVASDRLEQPLAQRLISYAEAMTEQGLSFKNIVLAK
jgi:GntR family transcriptional regulator